MGPNVYRPPEGIGSLIQKLAAGIPSSIVGMKRDEWSKTKITTWMRCGISKADWDGNDYKADSACGHCAPDRAGVWSI